MGYGALPTKPARAGNSLRIDYQTVNLVVGLRYSLRLNFGGLVRLTLVKLSVLDV